MEGGQYCRPHLRSRFHFLPLLAQDCESHHGEHKLNVSGLGVCEVVSSVLVPVAREEVFLMDLFVSLTSREEVHQRETACVEEKV